jgi:hypothetical protein
VSCTGFSVAAMAAGLGSAPLGSGSVGSVGSLVMQNQ